MSPPRLPEPHHVERWTIGPGSADALGRASPGALFGALQDIAGAHADALGLGMDALAADGRAWVLTRLRLCVERWPQEGEALRLRTWPTSFGRAIATRDFLVEAASGAAIAVASSSWAVFDLAARAAVRLPADWVTRLPAGEPAPLVPLERRLGLGDAPPERAAALTVRRADVDRVGHLNHVRAIELVLEGTPEAVWAGARLAELDIAFRREARAGETLVSEGAEIAPDTAGRRGVEHRLRRGDDVLVEARTRWDGGAPPQPEADEMAAPA